MKLNNSKIKLLSKAAKERKMKLYQNNVNLLTKKTTPKIMFFADLHGIYTKESFRKEILEKAKEDNPEIIMIGGDICQGSTWANDEKFAVLKDFIASLAETGTPVVLTLGNHDLSGFTAKSYENYMSLRDIPNVHPLYNNSVDIPFGSNGQYNAHICGLVTHAQDYVTVGGNLKTKLLNRAEEREKAIAKLIKELRENPPLKESDFNILLAHDPRQIRMDKVYDEARYFDVIFAGHVHNGYMPMAITKDSDILLDNDHLGLISLGNMKQRTYTRGTIYGREKYHIQQLPTKKFILVHHELADKISPEEARKFVLDTNYYTDKLTPLVITGGSNKYNVLDIDYSEYVLVEGNEQEENEKGPKL